MAEDRAIFKLEKHLAARWDSIRAADQETDRQRSRLEALLQQLSLTDDVAVVAYGSLARAEVTSGSDVDWTLLLDCRASEEHHATAVKVAKLLQDGGFNKPGPTGVFGSIAFSHDLVHQIGGQDDTNANTTRRVLLLLESIRIAGDAPDARQRVVNTVLKRYVVEDHSIGSTRPQLGVPRFLLNDITRYWRTLCVDFAYKAREREEGNALRNLKLRMSRKLLFAAGLLTCFGCELETSPSSGGEDCRRRTHDKHRCVDCLQTAMSSTPLDILARTVQDLGEQACNAARRVIDAYDGFLALLNCRQDRDHLKKLTGDFENDPMFHRGRRLSHEFRDGIQDLFFESHGELTKLTQHYGVF